MYLVSEVEGLAVFVVSEVEGLAVFVLFNDCEFFSLKYRVLALLKGLLFLRLLFEKEASFAINKLLPSS